jgi:hypothetical protein
MDELCCAHQTSRIFLRLLIALLLPAAAALILAVDATVEYCSGRQIKTKGFYRDTVRSTNEMSAT